MVKKFSEIVKENVVQSVDQSVVESVVKSLGESSCVKRVCSKWHNLDRSFNVDKPSNRH